MSRYGFQNLSEKIWLLVCSKFLHSWTARSFSSKIQIPFAGFDFATHDLSIRTDKRLWEIKENKY